MDKENFKKLLETQMQWPGVYTFKFVIPAEQLEAFTQLFDDEVMSSKPSKNGKYKSITIEKEVSQPEDVVEIYERVAVVPGLIAL